MTYDDLNIRSRKIATQLNTDPTIKWTGWKWDSSGLVAQWIDYTPHDDRHYYINLPGMQQGFVAKDAEFNIGTARVQLTDDFGYIADLIRDGFSQLSAHKEVAQ